MTLLFFIIEHSINDMNPNNYNREIKQRHFKLTGTEAILFCEDATTVKYTKYIMH